MGLERRYDRNMRTFSAKENARLRECSVCVAGCGGLGGYIIEMLARLGVGHITAIDGDRFDETNLNRQLLSTEALLGSSKARAAKVRALEINSQVSVRAVESFLTADNCAQLLSGHDLAMDGLDSVPARRVLEDGCCKAGIPFVHGAVAGWYGQVAVGWPGDRLFDVLYPACEEGGTETELGNPSFTPAAVAAIQVAEAVKVLLGREPVLRKKLLTVDLLDHGYELLEL